MPVISRHARALAHGVLTGLTNFYRRKRANTHNKKPSSAWAQA